MSFINRVTNQWKFAPITNIEESDFNENLEKFFKLGINGLIKENIQNSLDGRLPNSTLPVIVKIRLGKINASDIPGIEEVIGRIEHLKGRNKYAKSTIKHMCEQAKRQEINYISFEDINTKGLSGI